MITRLPHFVRVITWQLFNDLDHNNRIFFTDFVLYIGYSVEGNYFIFVNGDISYREYHTRHETFNVRFTK